MYRGAQDCKVYERLAEDGVTGDIIRPGGLHLTARAVTLCGLSPGDRLLDVGCGPGAAVEYLAFHHGFRAIGIDPSSVMLRCGLRRNPNLPLVRASGEILPFGDAQWDGILAECILSLAADPNSVLGECHRTLKRGGRLAITDVYARHCGDSSFEDLSVSCCLAGALPREDWQRRVEGAGFRVVLWEDHSKALKEFAAQLIFSQGSLQHFWRQMLQGGPKAAVDKIEQAVSCMKPGYFLLIAEKEKAFFLTGSTG